MVKEEFIELKTDVKYIRKTLDEMRDEVKTNTEFRNKATGVIALLGTIAGVIGGFIVWIFSKIWGDK